MSLLTVKSTKNLWFFSPTQLFTHGQWWSIFRIHRLQILKRRGPIISIPCSEQTQPQAVSHTQNYNAGQRPEGDLLLQGRAEVPKPPWGRGRGTRSGGRPGRLGEGAAVPAVVGALGLDTAALGALVDHLSWLQLQTLHVLFSGISFRYCPLQFNNNNV